MQAKGVRPTVSDSILEWDAAGKRIIIRDLVTQEEFRETENIQREAWGFQDLDVVPAAHIIAAKWAGGLALGAFDAGRMIGFVYGFPAMESGHLSMHSHMLAVRKESRRLQAGLQLKLAQRIRALEMGISEISWTFDPLQTLNASLNFTRLGVISNRYLVNFYGEETSSPLHRGVGTDRLWVRWLIDSDMVKARLKPIQGAEPSNHGGLPDRDTGRIALALSGEPGPALLCHQGNDWSAPWKPAESLEQARESARIAIEIPSNIEHFKLENIDMAQAWRASVQERFLAAFGAGFTAVDFTRVPTEEGDRSLYLLTKL